MNGRSRAVPLASLAAGVVLTLLLAVSLGLPRRLASLVSSRSSPHRLDGRVSPGEYAFGWSDEASKLSFQWSTSGDRLRGAISTPDTGWVAVGFGGQGPLMYGADIVIGYVDARGAHFRDHFADTPTSHQPDTALGGRDDIGAGAGLQATDGTTIEFERQLAARDTTDRAIQSGQTPVILASADADDFEAYHAGGRKAVALLDLFAGPPAASQRGTVLPDHLDDVQIFLATWAALLLLLGVHGLAHDWAERGAGPSDTEGGPSVASFAVLLVLDLGGFALFAAGIVLAAPVWLLGASLALGLLALAGLIVAYSRAFVPFEAVQHERDDGIPW